MPISRTKYEPKGILRIMIRKGRMDTQYMTVQSIGQHKEEEKKSHKEVGGGITKNTMCI